MADPNTETTNEAPTERIVPRWMDPHVRRKRLANIISILIGLTFIGSLLYLGTDKAYHHAIGGNKRNVIFMVSDGMGPASVSLARSFRQFRDDLPIDDVLNLDRKIIGVSRTRSSDSLVTDSAAGATAFSCAHKSYNNAVGVVPDGSPCGSVLEAAKRDGYMTGIVVTTRVTDATPGAFSAHVSTRSLEDNIAAQQLGYEGPLGTSLDLLMGGGRCHFIPKGHGGEGCRADEHNLIEKAVDDGWTYIQNLTELRGLNNNYNQLPLLALFAPKDIPFDIDRNPAEYPSLQEMTETAIGLLDGACRQNKECKGFFLLVEGSRIDHAGHNNDPAAQVREVLAYDAAFHSATQFADHAEYDTVVLSTSDHETGGLATARQVSEKYPDYLWYPKVLLNATRSSEFLAKRIVDRIDSASTKIDSFIESVFEECLGILDYTNHDLKQVKNAAANRARAQIQDLLSGAVSLRSQTGWSTHGHSAVDVNIYAHGNSKRLEEVLRSKLAGSVENTQIGDFLREFLDVDVESVTEELREKLKVPQPAKGLAAEEMEPFDDYHGGIGM